ncbi:ABC-type nitrate/sulfonate/bicarbonate transport system, ATPase component [Acetitomaculum ruminis DSM 5522]|uniref:ABC-type nitrate/sulfonate/bicarbonate transport system, ATPase component n=1 Tax=Acetitomaculum ruminis DSM 5522 TaxID=1120918 RepID=A0A1I0YTW8_9FIRM|nr:ATP-binding cassette domain-containing protein [Acetitomaculum ruminis]SFB16819.1 ABC-type nitrate/sulfonate/bicarbonate transport system, ATPase component [Acetitomaculum ruminis DSM 5522]
MILLKAVDISKKYGEKTIIESVNINLKKGETVSLLGVSGAGKTTLLHVLAGISPPDGGKVFLMEEDITKNPGKIAYMMQKDLLLEHKKIIDNVALPLIIKGKSKKEARKEAIKYFKDFGLDNTQYKYPSQLSGGMRQRAALLRTYLSSNKVALLDEPFSALDNITKSAIQKWYLDTIKKIDLSTIFITHDIDEAIYLSDRIYILKGKPATITDEIDLGNLKKDTEKDFNLTEKFLELKKMIISKLV